MGPAKGILTGYTLGGMAIIAPKLDHVVIDARDRIDEAMSVYLSLGFQLTKRGRHTVGSVNHLAVFDTDYLELLGFDNKSGAVRADISRFPVGLNGLVFAAEQSDALFNDLRARGLAVEPPIAFSRPVEVAGRSEDAQFRIVRLSAGAVSYGRVYFCQHLTRELVWRPEWRQHPNGAMAVARVTIALQDPAASAIVFDRMFGRDAVRQAPSGVWTLAAGTVQIDVIGQEELRRRFGDAVPDPAGRADYIAALTIRTASLSQAAQALRAGGIDRACIEPERTIIPAAEAMNVTLEFVE